MSFIIINNYKFDAITAISEVEQAKGLMKVAWPPPIMVFPSEQPEYRKFWMNNTPSPLDIVFIKENKIISIAKGEPFSTEMVGPNVKVDCVVEFPYGSMKKINAKLNDDIEILYSQEERNKILKTIM